MAHRPAAVGRHADLRQEPETYTHDSKRYANSLYAEAPKRQHATRNTQKRSRETESERERASERCKTCLKRATQPFHNATEKRQRAEHDRNPETKLKHTP
eukprot:5696343-Alexandrium_andersonii.AAC.1